MDLRRAAKDRILTDARAPAALVMIRGAGGGKVEGELVCLLPKDQEQWLRRVVADMLKDCES